MSDRVPIVQQNLVSYLRGAAVSQARLAPEAPLGMARSLSVGRALSLFEDQLTSRYLDVVARELKATGRGYYTISSAGHEQNAVFGAQLRLTDPCFLHYRSGALMVARSRQAPEVDAVRDTLLSLAACADDPISGGRHKVFGSRRLWVPPQTSTIASHLPKAVGMAFALGLRGRLPVTPELPGDAIVLCSFGDASTGHAAALAGIHAARYAARRGNPMPILFLCEDNRVGISVDKPRRWLSDSFSRLSQLEYHVAEGSLDAIWSSAEAAIAFCRSRRRPIFLRLPTVRLWGHAGSDVETTYHTLAEIEAVEADDPLLANARLLVEIGAATPSELLERLESIALRVRQAAGELADCPKLASAAEVAAPIAPYDEARCRAAAAGAVDVERRSLHFEARLPEAAAGPTRRTLAAHINAALQDEMLRRPELIVFGEDVGKKGGVYHVTGELQKRFGRARVFDTLLDETTILGVAQGAAHAGLLPVPEIQYLAYVHNALDQLRGEACSLSYFSNGQFRCPMVVRVASFAYQRGFGGHFHNDNAIGALRDIPGLVLAAPARGDDAVRILRGLVALAAECGRISCFLEPIALYHEKDLYKEGDRAWLSDYPPPGSPDSALLPGEVGIYHEGHADLLIVSYANGLRLSLRAARTLAAEAGIRARVLDLRWLNPLPSEALARHAADCGGVLVADECRATGGGVADAIIAGLAEAGYGRPLRSVRSHDSYVPLGPAADSVLLSEAQIVAAARALLKA